MSRIRSTLQIYRCRFLRDIVWNPCLNDPRAQSVSQFFAQCPFHDVLCTGHNKESHARVAHASIRASTTLSAACGSPMGATDSVQAAWDTVPNGGYKNSRDFCPFIPVIPSRSRMTEPRNTFQHPLSFEGEESAFRPAQTSTWPRSVGLLPQS